MGTFHSGGGLFIKHIELRKMTFLCHFPPIKHQPILLSFSFGVLASHQMFFQSRDTERWEVQQCLASKEISSISAHVQTHLPCSLKGKLRNLKLCKSE